MLKIAKVDKQGLGRALGLEKGDEILAFDGIPCVDELDYVYLLPATSFTMTVRDKLGERTETLRVDKEEDESLGIEFEKNESIRTCHNRCLFCFVDQMPANMRETLYVKDDDYTMSFACGNFVTLTNLSDRDLQRIVRLKMSPLYISVHTMNESLRCTLLRNRFAGKIVEQVETLVRGGITLHCQAVLVPGLNDGDELAYTARKLFGYYPAVRDLACVPTGLTKYRDGLHPIADVDKEYCEKLLDLVDELNAEFGVDFLLPADEYFVRAERPLKPTSFYGDFSQIENGVGMTSKFHEEFFSALSDRKKSGKYALKKPKKTLLICGVSAAKVNAPLLEAANQAIEGLTAIALPVVNRFFGESVTCTGLLTGRDVVDAVQAYLCENGRVDEIVFPGDMMKEFEDVFLCGMTLKEMQKKLPKVKVRVNRQGGAGLVDILVTR